jgi:hypothetical protein
MKRELSVSIEECTIDGIDYFLRDGTFRNKSQLIEFTLTKFMNEARK